MNTNIQIKIKLFGALRKYSDGKELALEVPARSRIQDVRRVLNEELARTHEGYREHGVVADSAFACDTQILSESAVIAQNSVLAVLPPVCGG